LPSFPRAAHPLHPAPVQSQPNSAAYRITTSAPPQHLLARYASPVSAR
jgi:hypothetical protein